MQGIEWGGDIHVPHGSIQLARQVRDKTLAAGLEVAAYGSYYRTAVSEPAGLTFESVLQTAQALGAPTIRVWAGDKNYADAGAELIGRIVDDTLRIAGLAQQAGITVAFEYHGGTLTNTLGSTLAFANLVRHDAVKFYWQPRLGCPTDEALGELGAIAGRLGNVHVFQWTTSAGAMIQQPLQKGIEAWSKYFDLLRHVGGDRYALLEFVQDDSPANVLRDAAVLERFSE